MPSAPRRPCTWPGCPQLVKRGRCARHTRESRREEDQHRGSRHRRGYDAAWDRLRLEILERDNYLCQIGRGRPGCLVDATEVDHKRAKADGGTDHPSNLQAVCGPCHARKTGAERAARNRRRATPGGANSSGIEFSGPPSQLFSHIRDSENVRSR